MGSADKELFQSFIEIQQRARDIFDKKNQDYGSSNIARGGMEGLIARMDDKLSRLRNLVATGQDHVGESVSDTCVDLCNYAAMATLVAEGKWPGAVSVVSAIQQHGTSLMYTDEQVDGVPHIFAPQLPGDVGYDVAICEDVMLYPNQGPRYVRTGVRVKAPHGCWVQICGRSSTMRKHHCEVVMGVLDENYTGEVLVGMMCAGNQPVRFLPNSRVAQLIIVPSIVRPLVKVAELPNTERSSMGFGSTGQ